MATKKVSVPPTEGRQIGRTRYRYTDEQIKGIREGIYKRLRELVPEDVAAHRADHFVSGLRRRAKTVR